MPRNDCIFTFDIAQIKYEWIYKLFIVQLQIHWSSITFLLKRQGWPHKVPVVLPNLVKAIFVHTSGTSSLFLSESLGAIFFLQLCFPCCFYQDGWSTAIKVLPSVWDSEFLITCFAAFLVRFSICLLFSVSLPEIRLWFLCWRATCSTLQGCVNFLYH